MAAMTNTRTKNLLLISHLLVFVISATYGQSTADFCPSADPYVTTVDEDDADVTVGAVLRVHGPGAGVYGCGTLEAEGLHYFEALRWAVRALNKREGEVAGVAVNDSFVPGIKIGLRVYDSCGHKELALRYMTELFPVMKSGSEDCMEQKDNSTTVIGMMDMSSSLSEARVAETAGRYVIPVIPLRQETAVPPEQLAKVLAEVVHDMDWERVTVVHADDEYSIFVTKVFSQLAKAGQPCVASIRPLLRGSDQDHRKSYHRTLSSLASKLPDNTGVIVIGFEEVFKKVIQVLGDSPTTFSRLQWLFSWMLPFPNLETIRNTLRNRQIFSLSPFPQEITTFEDYWRRLGDTASVQEANDRFFMEYVMAQKNCRIAGYKNSAYNNIAVCENLVLKENASDRLLRTARFLPALHSLYTFAHAYRRAWQAKCRGVPGSCLNLRRMGRPEFVESFLEPLEFEHAPQGRSPPGVQGQKTALGTSGEMEGMRLALNAYTDRGGVQFKQVLAYDSKEAKVLDPSFRYVPSECPKGGCKDCISARQSRFEDPYIGMASSSEFVTANESDDISIPILLPIHKPGKNPLECSDEINPEAVQDLEAALWTIDQINRDTEFLPEIRLGVVIVDTCSTPVQITQKLSNYLLDTKKKDMDDFTSDLAFVAVGSPEEIAAATSVISSLNVTTISVSDSLRQKDDKHHLLQIAVPFEKKTKATVDTLRYLGWNYVTVIHDGDTRSEIMLESFKSFAKAGEICVSVELSTSGKSDKEMDELVKTVVAAKKKGARAVVMWTNERTTRSFLQGVHRAVLSGLVSRGDLVIISSGDWIVNLQSFKEFENEATGVIVLKTQQGEVEDFATYYQRLQPEANKRNVWFRELWEQRKECIDTKCEVNMSGIPIEYKPSTSTVNIIQGLLAISAGLARLRNELCHPEPGLCPKMLQTPQLREHLYNYIRETASSRLDAKGEMFAFTKQGYGNLPIEIFNFRRAAGKNFVYQKVGTYDTHLNNLAEIVVYNSNGEEITVDKMTSDCIEDCGVCEKRPTDFVILDSKDHLYLATSVDIHDSSPNPLSCGPEVTTSGLQTLEAFLWALDQINGSPQILPGVNLGAIVFDTCSSKEKAARDVANFFSSSLSSASPMPKLPSVNQILGLVATQTDSVIQPIIDVAMPFKMMTLAPRVTSTSFNDVEKYPSLLRPSLPNDVRAGALADLLKHFRWDYVSVLSSDGHQREGDMFESFKLKARAKEIEFAMEEKISAAFPNAAMKILLGKLKDKQKEGAKVVVLFLDDRTATNLFAVVKEELDAGRIDTGDFVWVTFDSVDAFHQFPMAVLGAVMMQPAHATVLPFRQYFGTLNPRNNSRNPWFRDYWEQVFKCRGAGCDHRHQTLSEKSVLQDSGVSKVVNSVLALGLGLESLRQYLCPGTDRGLCPAVSQMDPGLLRDTLFNLTSEGSFPGSDGKIFRFTNRGFAANTLEVLNFRQVGSNAHAFVNVGTYSPDEGLSLNFSKVRTYNEFGKEISLYDIKSTCKDCKRNTADKFTSAMQIVPKQDFAILAIMPVHSKGTTFFECGGLRDERMFHHLSGIAFAVDKINKNSTLMPGVEIGTIVFDYCDRPQRGQDQLYSFFSKDHSSMGSNGLRIKPKSVIAAMTYGTGMSKESSAIFDSLNVMQIATPIDRMESSAFNDILYTAPSTMSQIQALLSILRKFNWMYVNVVYSNTDFGRSGYYQFSKEAKEMEVCLANVVIVEPNSKRGSILTNLQNGLNRDATVVVSLVDDDQVVQNMVEAIKMSSMLTKYVWVGTETWGNNPTVMTSLQDATFDAVTLKLESHDMPDYKKFYEGLTLWNHFPIPDSWFEEFWQHRFQCQLPSSDVQQKQYTPVCTGKEQLSSDELSHQEHIYQTVKTIQSVTEGLHNFLSRKCPYGMAAMNIDDCGGGARSELRKEIETILHGSYSDCEECTSSSTIFGYDIVQHSLADNLTNIGSWKDGILFMDESKISFSTESVPRSECKEDCGTCKEQMDSGHQHLVADRPIWSNFQTVWGIIVTSLSILGILLVIICALYFLMSFPVTVGTTVLGYMILFGLLLLYAVNFAFVLQPTEGTCGIRRFGLGLAYAVIFAGMLVKVMNTWRLMGYNGSRILSDGTRLSSPAGLLVIAVGLVIIQIVLSSAWLILMPPRTGAYEGAWRCAPPTTFEEGLVVSLVYVMLLLAITALFALLTWQCQDNNRESRWILACTLAAGMVWLAWTVLSTQLPPRHRDAAIAAANLANATLIMVCLYLRKVYLYSKLSRQARDQDLKTHLQPGSYTHSIYGSSQKTFSTLAPVLYGSQASLTTKKLYNGPSSRVELINCPEDNKSDSSSGGSVQVQATDLYPLDMYDGGSQFQPVTSLYGSNHTLVLDDTITFGR